MVGKTILHYKILEKLGEGGMGVVYKAEDTKLERVVAIKFLPHHIAANAEERERFKIEAKAAAALNHPNIATIYAIEEVDGEMFIVMEFIDGRELKKLIIANSQLSIDNCLAYANQIAEGLKAAHAKGVTHRDIKSSNIMVTESGQVKIMDFGLAKIGGGVHLTKSGMMLGTVAYMSPELVRGAEIDHRTDIWALGVVLYEMITGQLPFKGEYEQAVMYSILNEAPEPITKLRANVSMELERVVKKALQKDRANRYQHVNELLADLKSATKVLASEPAGTIKPKLPRRKRAFLYGGIAVLLILLVVGKLYFFTGRSRTIDAIAVLPLTNLSGDPNKEFFADGMTEALISDLGQIEALRVISRTSVMQYKNLMKPLPKIAKELNVDAVVEGSVQSSGDQVEINVRLIEATTEQRLWSKSYGRELRDVLTLQREMALAIAREINAQVTMEERTRLEKTHTVDPKAYELYLWGRNFRDKETLESLKQAVHYFERAIAIDPNFAPAHADLVVPYYMLGGRIGGILVEEAESKARQAAAKALQLDKINAEAHTGLGVIREFYDWDWSGAEEEFRQAVELNPSSKVSHHEYGLFLIRMGKTEEGLAELKRAQEVDPLSETTNANVAWAYIYNRLYDQAIEQCRKTLTFFPNSARTHLVLGQAHLQKRMYEEAIRVLETEAAASSGLTYRFGLLGSAYALSGHRDKSLKILEELQVQQKRWKGLIESIATIYTSLGEKNEALTWLERAYDERSPVLVQFIQNPIFDPLRSEPRFEALLKKMRLEK